MKGVNNKARRTPTWCMPLLWCRGEPHLRRRPAPGPARQVGEEGHAQAAERPMRQGRLPTARVHHPLMDTAHRTGTDASRSAASCPSSANARNESDTGYGRITPKECVRSLSAFQSQAFVPQFRLDYSSASSSAVESSSSVGIKRAGLVTRSARHIFMAVPKVMFSIRKLPVSYCAIRPRDMPGTFSASCCWVKPRLSLNSRNPITCFAMPLPYASSLPACSANCPMVSRSISARVVPWSRAYSEAWK